MTGTNNPKTASDPYADITPADSPKTLADLIADPSFLDLCVPNVKVGDPCFDFDLEIYDFSDGTRRETGKRFGLARAAENQPVALIFGSYT